LRFLVEAWKLTAMRSLDEFIKDLVAHRAELASELERVDRALSALGVVPAGSALRIGAAPAGIAATTHSGPVWRQVGAPEPANMLNMLRQIFSDNLDKTYNAVEAEAELKHRGWQTDASDPVNAVRAALSRLNDAGDVYRVNRGRYQSASAPVEFRSQVAADVSPEETLADVVSPWVAQESPDGGGG
jgi:hypothetical protein